MLFLVNSMLRWIFSYESQHYVFFQHVVYMNISVFNIYKVGSDVCYLLAMQLLTDISQY